MKRNGIVCAGSWVVDVIKTVDRWPDEETLSIIDSQTVRCGGPGQNMAIDLARLGARFPIAAAARLGDDTHADVIRESCRDHGIDSRGLLVSPGLPTGFTDVISVRGTGRRTFFYCEGAGGRLLPQDFDVASSQARIFHLGAPGIHGAMDQPTADGGNGWVTVLRAAKALGFRTNMELVTLAPERLVELVHPCLPLLDTLIVNDAEIGALGAERTVGRDGTDVSACRRAARRLVDDHGLGLAVAHFPGGCIAEAVDVSLVMPSVDVPTEEVVGTNGAGDAFAAGVVFGLHDAWPLENALRLGHATAAASLRSLSTSESVDTAERCLALAERWGWRDLPDGA
ncbi:MAG: carbohydrate kinase family protein [Pseudomonadota bacterium]